MHLIWEDYWYRIAGFSREDFNLAVTLEIHHVKTLFREHLLTQTLPITTSAASTNYH